MADGLPPANRVDDVLITEALDERPTSDDGLVSHAFVQLARVMANDPDALPQALCNVALELCKAGSSGISILKRGDDGQEYFHWEAIAGLFAPYVGGSTPRDFSPSGVSLERGATQLFSYPDRFFTYLQDIAPPVVEALVVPFDASSGPMGAIWVLSHHDHQFSRADATTMEGLAEFTAAALSLIATGHRADQIAIRAEAGRKDFASQAGLLEELNINLQVLLGQADATTRELTVANEVKDEFLSLVSHELRSPLTVILGYTKLLLRTKSRLSEDGRREALVDIERQGTRLQKIIENLLLLARPEVAKIGLTEPVALHQVIQNVALNHQRYFPDRRFLLPSTTFRPVAIGRTDFVEEILENLVSNAEKYSPEDKPIEFVLEATHGYVEIAVLDAGPGVDDTERVEIFSSFYRSSKTSSRATGLGIGLAVCKLLVEKQSGKIWVTQREGGGSAFRFTLPVYPRTDDLTDDHST
jgi:signal transduction histidine kinase